MGFRVDRERGWSALVSRPGYPRFVLTVSLARVAAPMFIVSGVLLVLARTHDTTLAGLTAAAATLPSAITGPLLGAWLDLTQHRRLLIVGDQLLSAAGLILLILLAGHAPDWTVPVAAIVYSFSTPVSTGSFVSVLTEVAGPELLDRASAVEATSLNLGFIIGPALAGGLAAALSPVAAIEGQIVLVLAVAVLVAPNRVFEARPAERPSSLAEAVRTGTRALLSHRPLRNIGLASVLGNMSWSLMVIGFPLLAAQRLHAGAHAGGYLWGALAAGSILGTFVIPGAPSARRTAASYLSLGFSALIWLFASGLSAGVPLVLLTGFLEGPAYSGVITLRQRYAPAAVRAQVISTLGSLNLTASAVAIVLAGAISRPVILIAVFVALNVVAATLALQATAKVPTESTER